MPSDHNSVTNARDDGWRRKVSQEELDALNNLVQDGLVEVVSRAGLCRAPVPACARCAHAAPVG
jgi:hypothetical protein